MVMELMTNMCKVLASLLHESHSVHKSLHADTLKTKSKGTTTQKKVNERLTHTQGRTESLEKRFQEFFTG